MFLIYLCLDLVSNQHQVCPGRHGVTEKVLVLALQLESVLVDVLSVLLCNFLSVISGILHLELAFISVLWSVIDDLTSLICLTLLNLMRRTIG